MTCKTASMLKTVLIIATLLLALAASCIVHAYRYTSSQFLLQYVKVISSTPLRAGPVIIQITVLHNDSQTILRNVDFSLLIDEGKVITPPHHLSYVYPLQTITLRYIVNTTTNKEHVITLIIEWGRAYRAVSIQSTNMYNIGTLVRDIRDKQSISAIVYVPGEPLLTVKSLHSVVIPGAESKLTLYLCNNGSAAAYNILTSFTLQPPVGTSIRILNSTSTVIPRIEPGECRRVVLNLLAYSLSGEVLSQAVMVVSLTYFDESGNRYSSTYKVNVPILSTGLLKIVPSRTYVRTGSLDRLDLHVCNMFPITVHDITLSILSATGVIVNSTRVVIRKLDPGTCRDITIILKVPRGASVMSKTCTIVYLLSYKLGENVEISEQRSISLSVLASPRVIIADMISAPSVARVGELVSLSIRIINTGDAAAYNVNVSLIDCERLKPVTENYEFFGKLNPQDESIASFTLNATQIGKGECKVVLTYVDLLGDIHRVVKVFSIPIVRSNITFVTSMMMTPHVSTSMTMIFTVVSVLAVIATITIVLIVVRRKRRL